MIGKPYVVVTERLNANGFLPQGRYEHIRKNDSVPVGILWTHQKTGTELMIFVSINDLGDLDKVTSVFRKETIQ